ncbi:MAG: thioesterase family protein [Chloroflexi bacterium]|nr:thioesterase family protein [Chloroflexota bacterium]
MNPFRFNYPIVVRYGDLDPQWHVNNTRFLNFAEQARFAYLVELGLFDGNSFWDLPWIVGDIHCRYLVPIDPGVTVMVSMGVTGIGSKSLTMETYLTGEGGSPLHATIETILVAYDYRAKKTIPVPDEMRARVEVYEGKTFFRGEKVSAQRD